MKRRNEEKGRNRWRNKRFEITGNEVKILIKANMIECFILNGRTSYRTKDFPLSINESNLEIARLFFNNASF